MGFLFGFGISTGNWTGLDWTGLDSVYIPYCLGMKLSPSVDLVDLLELIPKVHKYTGVQVHRLCVWLGLMGSLSNVPSPVLPPDFLWGFATARFVFVLSTLLIFSILFTSPLTNAPC